MALSTASILYIYQGCNQLTQTQSITDTFGSRFASDLTIKTAYFSNTNTQPTYKLGELKCCPGINQVYSNNCQ